MAISADDYAALQQLSVRYAQSLDDGDAQAVADCFASDGVFDLATGALEGRDAILAWARDYTPSGRHVVGGVLADVDGDRGTVRGYTLFHDGNAPGTVLSVVYEDEVVREGGTWRFQKRTVPEVRGAAAA